MACATLAPYSKAMFKHFARHHPDPVSRLPARLKDQPEGAMTLRVMLVDDSKTFAAAVRQFLDRVPGLEIVGQAHDGKEALIQVAANHPDVLLLDIAMPGMNGLELARALRMQARVPRIIFLSMQDNRAYREAALEMGADFVGKSEFVAELIPMLEQMAATHNEDPRSAD